MTRTTDFAHPPIVELVLGVQFSPLTKLKAGHFGLFWNELGGDWINPEDGALLEDQFELFDGVSGGGGANFLFRLEPTRLPGRFLLGHKDQDRLLQIQSSRFHLNWRKREGTYPSYKRLIVEFEDLFARFSAFAVKMAWGKLALNQWELTYVDAFPKEEYWQTTADWSKFLPGFFGGLFPTDGLGITLEHRMAEWRYEMQPKRGRLHISARPGRVGEEKQEALLLQMTARGPIGPGGAETMRVGLDWGHEAAVGVFLRAVSDETKQRWEIKS